MDPRILIAYATRAGSTIEVSQAIAETLQARGFTVDLKPVKEQPDVSGYLAVVMGSAVRFGQWLPEAVKFVEQNRAALSQTPTAFFSVHLMNMADDAASLKGRQAYHEPLRKLVSPKAEAFFAGVGDFGKVALLERMIAKMVKSPQGDFRDWAKIRGWAQTLFA